MVSGFQGMMKALSKLYIFAGIGDEYVDHISGPLRLKLRCLIWHSNTVAVSRKSGRLSVGRLSVISVDEPCRHLLDDAA